MKEKIICRVLTGPTASGKTDLSLELAERNGWEIACMDSMQIYRGMDIGTAKPAAGDRQRVKHHLLDLCSPQENFSVAMYREMAEELIRRKWEEERRELLFVGGTVLYLRAMMHPMSMGNIPADEKMRDELHAIADQPGGREILHGILRECDPETAERIPLNDIRRTIRAIEVSRITGIPFSRQPEREERSPFEWRVAAGSIPREKLYERINGRVTDMFRQGLAEEVRNLLNQGVSPEAQSMQALGYKETVLYLEGARTLEQTVDEIRKGTRHYAKRQMTFLRKETDVRYFDALSPGRVSEAENLLQEHRQS